MSGRYGPAEKQRTFYRTPFGFWIPFPPSPACPVLALPRASHYTTYSRRSQLARRPSFHSSRLHVLSYVRICPSRSLTTFHFPLPLPLSWPSASCHDVRTVSTSVYLSLSLLAHLGILLSVIMVLSPFLADLSPCYRSQRIIFTTYGKWYIPTPEPKTLTLGLPASAWRGFDPSFSSGKCRVRPHEIGGASTSTLYSSRLPGRHRLPCLGPLQRGFHQRPVQPGLRVTDRQAASHEWDSCWVALPRALRYLSTPSPLRQTGVEITLWSACSLSPGRWGSRLWEQNGLRAVFPSRKSRSFKTSRRPRLPPRGYTAIVPFASRVSGSAGPVGEAKSAAKISGAVGNFKTSINC